MQLSTVICNYNTRDDLACALESLQATTGDLDHEIIVVDNASQDGSAALVRERFPAVDLIEPGVNRWFTGGNNLGIRVAQGEYVLILNPDTVIQPGALQTMIAHLDAHPEAGAVTCRMVFGDGTVQHNCSRFATYPDLLLGYSFLGLLFKAWRDRRRRVMWYADWDRESDRAVEVAPGSNLMVRRALLEQLGYFNERLKLYFPEDDLCLRLHQAGHQVHYVAGATIIHHEHTSVSQVQRLATRVYFDDLITYTRLHFGLWRAWLLAGLVAPTRVAMWIKQSIKG